MEPNVLLVTVTMAEGTSPVAHGIYQSQSQILQQLHAVGMHPGFDCTYKPMFNVDGTPAGVLFGNEAYIVTVSAMPLSIAAGITRGESVWEIPDTLEGLCNA